MAPGGVLREIEGRFVPSGLMARPVTGLDSQSLAGHKSPVGFRVSSPVNRDTCAPIVVHPRQCHRASPAVDNSPLLARSASGQLSPHVPFDSSPSRTPSISGIASCRGRRGVSIHSPHHARRFSSLFACVRERAINPLKPAFGESGFWAVHGHGWRSGTFLHCLTIKLNTSEIASSKF